MPITEIVLFNFVKENISKLNSNDLTLKFIELYPEYTSEDTKSLHRRIIRVYDKIKKYKKTCLKKNSQENLLIAETALFPILPKIPSNNLPDAEEKEENNQTESVSKAYIEELHIQINYLKQENTYLRNQCLVPGENAATSLEEYDKAVNDLQSLADEAEKNYDAILSANRNELEQLQQRLTEIEETYFETQLSLDEAESKVKKYCTRNVKNQDQTV